MPEIFTVDLKVRPYVRQYIINNCGDPADLRHLPLLDNLFWQLIRKPLLRFESLPRPSSDTYISIAIPEDKFYRYGWEMSNTGLMKFNRTAEGMIKFFMRSYVGMRTKLGFTIAYSIRKFQQEWNFPEDVWSYEAIKKDLFRYTDYKRDDKVNKLINEIDNEIRNVLLENLYDLGTISNIYKNELTKNK